MAAIRLLVLMQPIIMSKRPYALNCMVSRYKGKGDSLELMVCARIVWGCTIVT